MNTNTFKYTLRSCSVNLYIQQVRHALSYTTNEAENSKKALEILNTELVILRTKCTHLEITAIAKQEAIGNLEKQNKKLVSEMDALKKSKVRWSYVPTLHH